MIGGRVLSVYRFKDRFSVVVRGTGSEVNDVLAIDLDLSAPEIKYGDGIWWQSDIALWTPKNGSVEDVHIPRIGYSYSADVLWVKVAQHCRAGICPSCTSDFTMNDGNGRLWCNICGASYDMSTVVVEPPS